jgi:hypothetical protein
VTQALLPRLWAWLVGPEREPHPPPEWVFRPIVGIVALLISIVLFMTPAALLGFGSWIILAVEVYEDRRALGLPYFWWSSAVGTFGPLVFLMYVQNRRETLANMRPQAGGGTSPAAWYPDPLGRARLRWWDGGSWTRQVHP